MLSETIESLRARLQRNGLSGLNERNTDRVFVTPVLEALGWDLSNLDEVMADYFIKDLAQGSSASYALYSQGQPVLLVHILPLFSDINNIQSYTKVFVTAKASPANCLAITNGVQWLVYNVDVNMDQSSSPILYCDIRESTADKYLPLLSKVSIREGSLNDFMQENPQIEIKQKEQNAKTRGYKITIVHH